MKRKRYFDYEKQKIYNENAALRNIVIAALSIDKLMKKEMAQLRSNFADQLYNLSEPQQ